MSQGRIELENANGQWVGDVEVGGMAARRVVIRDATLGGAIAQVLIAYDGIVPGGHEPATVIAELHRHFGQPANAGADPGAVDPEEGDEEAEEGDEETGDGEAEPAGDTDPNAAAAGATATPPASANKRPGKRGKRRKGRAQRAAAAASGGATPQA